MFGFKGLTVFSCRERVLILRYGEYEVNRKVENNYENENEESPYNEHVPCPV